MRRLELRLARRAELVEACADLGREPPWATSASNGGAGLHPLSRSARSDGDDAIPWLTSASSVS
ncbi:MAG: hypothetical protein K8H88_12625 [Sandaracinaceae bacterium]|nr:hypothetical protein [Sandaracinaceae bacterium]